MRGAPSRRVVNLFLLGCAQLVGCSCFSVLLLRTSDSVAVRALLAMPRRFVVLIPQALTSMKNCSPKPETRTAWMTAMLCKDKIFDRITLYLSKISFVFIILIFFLLIKVSVQDIFGRLRFQN